MLLMEIGLALLLEIALQTIYFLLFQYLISKVMTLELSSRVLLMKKFFLIMLFVFTIQRKRHLVNLPFEVGVYAADEESIYEIIGSSKNKSLVTTSPIELVKVKVKDLATDEISVKSISELHIHGFNETFNDSLIKLTKSSNPAVKAYLKAAYLYSKNFKEMIDHAEGMLALEDDSNFMDLLKNICDKSSSKRLNTRGEYFVNGDDI